VQAPSRPSCLAGLRRANISRHSPRRRPPRAPRSYVESAQGWDAGLPEAALRNANGKDLTSKDSDFAEAAAK
jgi:hypothetical protein